jgi:limonene-1,2-epoxide hydrolase
MTASQQTATRFYRAFQSGDAAVMASCYHPELQYSDPVFGKLSHKEACGMWTMLLERSKGALQIEFDILSADASEVQVKWVASYPFGKYKRPVTNVILAKMHIEGGLIVQHHDRFNFWKWSRQALGISGWLLGWTPLLQNKVRQQSRQLLKKQLSKQSL